MRLNADVRVVQKLLISVHNIGPDQIHTLYISHHADVKCIKNYRSTRQQDGNIRVTEQLARPDL